MDKIPVYILAGGRSSRFGADKARALCRGETLLARVADSIGPVAQRITVVARLAGQYADLGLQTIPDRVTGLGPIGGLWTALEDNPPAPWLLLLACDAIGVNAGWVAALLASRQPGAPAVAFKPDKWQPLFALYHTSITSMVCEHIAARRFALQGLLDAANAVAAPLPEGWDHFQNVNTRGDLAQCENAHAPLMTPCQQITPARSPVRPYPRRR